MPGVQRAWVPLSEDRGAAFCLPDTVDPRGPKANPLGSAFYGAVVAKVLSVRSTRFASWVLPVAGGLLFSILLGLWTTSALWSFAVGAA